MRKSACTRDEDVGPADLANGQIGVADAKGKRGVRPATPPGDSLKVRELSIKVGHQRRALGAFDVQDDSNRALEATLANAQEEVV